MILVTVFPFVLKGKPTHKKPPLMSRKPKKGYFVRGQFVAEGSELDLELKAELKGTEGLSRTDRKKDSDERQDLGVELLTLRNELIERLNTQGHMTDQLREALAEARRITNFEGKRRQMQYVGKLMRKLSEESPSKRSKMPSTSNAWVAPKTPWHCIWLRAGVTAYWPTTVRCKSG